MPRRAENLLAPLLFALLVIATLGAFAGAQRLKREPLVLDKLTLAPLVSGKTVITPNGDGRGEVARIRFRLTKTDRGRVEIIDKDDRTVRALSGRIVDRRGGPGPRVPPGSVLPSYKPLVFRWDGRDRTGKVGATGPYRLRVSLLTEHRTLVPLGRIRVHTRAGVTAGAGGGRG